jgi:hypothetical protein
VNAVQTAFDQFRDTPYIQRDSRVVLPERRVRALMHPVINFMAGEDPLDSRDQLHVPARVLGYFFGPRTTVGISVARN